MHPLDISLLRCQREAPFALTNSFSCLELGASWGDILELAIMGYRIVVKSFCCSLHITPIEVKAETLRRAKKLRTEFQFDGIIRVITCSLPHTCNSRFNFILHRGVVTYAYSMRQLRLIQYALVQRFFDVM